MEEENKVPNTSEPNPNGEDEVSTADVTDNGNQTTDPAEAGEKGNEKGEEPKPSEDGTPNPKKQDRDTDAKYAEERRKRKEREEARQREREEEIRRQAVFEVKSGQVSSDELKELSLEKVENEDQLFLVEQLRKAKAEGVENPLAEAYKSLFKKQVDDKAKAQAEAQARKAAEDAKKAIVAKDQQAFKAKFNKSTADVMKTDTEFMSLFGNLIDQEKGNFTELYSAYTKMKEERATQAKKEGAFPTSSQGSSAGNPSGETDQDFKERYIAEYGHW